MGDTRAAEVRRVADLVESRSADRLLACDCWPQAVCLARAV
ncbi:MAG: hypothetical protein ACREM1_01485 [Longimicrobiales bacterium]